MPNYKSIYSGAGGKYVLLDQHLATGTEADYTYTPIIALDLKATYRQIIILITGKAITTQECRDNPENKLLTTCHPEAIKRIEHDFNTAMQKVEVPTVERPKRTNRT